MTKKALSEAQAFVERSIANQERLGYGKPSTREVEAATKRAAIAVNALLELRTKTPA